MRFPPGSAARVIVRAVLVVFTLSLSISPVVAQGSGGGTGTIEGTVSTQNGTVKLPGVVVTIRAVSAQDVTQHVSDNEGRFVAADVPAGRYVVRASLDGFEPIEQEAAVEPGGHISLMLDLAISAVSEHVDVVAKAPVFESPTVATSEAVSGTEAQLLLPGQGVQSALRLTTGVIQLPGGNSIDGGRPFQAGMQMGAGTLIDPATNLARLQLPSGVVDSVTVLPNPYEVEFGRFSSGLVVVQTKRAGDRWKTSVDNLEPALRLKRFTVWDVTGITVWQPTLEVGGPLVKDRVFLEQAAQYRYQTTDIPARPETELKHNQLFNSLTRVDSTLTSRHSLLVSGGYVPSITTQATLGTFVPPAATADITDDVAHGMVSERALLGASASLESTVQLVHYRTDVGGQGIGPMVLLPETTLGTFFNTQHRSTQTVQWVETLAHSYKGLGGMHLLKGGTDVLHASYDGTSDSTSLLINRSDGTLARQLDFAGQSVQSVHSTDAALFLQDRFQPAPRVYLQFGGRVDYDGVTATTNVTPRMGIVIGLNASGTATLRGGYGLFYERTPSVAAAFPQFETSTDTRFARDGVTALGPAVPVRNVAAFHLQAARSSTWDVAFDHRVNRSLTVHAGVLDRQGTHELIVDPVLTEQGGEYLLSSSGRSNYVQEEVEVHVARGVRTDVNASFVHSSAHEDLNSLLNFVDIVLQPVIGVNAYAPAAADAPSRLLLRGRTMVKGGWQLLGTVDWRSGLPYSVVNEDLEFVGPRNVLRFPTYFRVDAGFEHRMSIAGRHPWLGMRVSNALNSFLPSDVQANIDSPDFGSFYNSVYREYRLAIRFGT